MNAGIHLADTSGLGLWGQFWQVFQIRMAIGLCIGALAAGQALAFGTGLGLISGRAGRNDVGGNGQ